MNYRTVFHTIGNMLTVEGALLMLPLLVSVIYGEFMSGVGALAAAVVAFSAGFLLTRLKHDDSPMRARDGFVIVSLSWIFVSVIGALPYYISGEISDPVNAFFESVSGLTTTGASILHDIESMSHGMLFWRSLTIGIGGMGILVFLLAVLPPLKGDAVHLLKAESTGPSVSKIVPRLKTSVSILYIIFIVLAALEFILLVLGGMPVFDSINHAISTIGTGGFSVKNASIAAYGSDYIEMVIIIFMFIGGINFTLIYMMVNRRFGEAVSNSELKGYFFTVVVCTALIAANLILTGTYPNIENPKPADAVRDSAFTVTAIITTTGFTVADFDTWPGFSRIIIMILMFSGACSGSTSGGFKISRTIILLKTVWADIRQIISPHSVKRIKLSGQVLGRNTLSGVYSFTILYITIITISIILISINDFDMVTTCTSVITSINNVGPAFADAGPTLNFDHFSDFSKIVLCFDMLAGRLEIFPIIMLLNPRTWKRY